MQIKDKVAFITGAAHRVGKAIALRCAAQGAHIALHYHTSTQAAQETTAELRALGVEVLPLQADLTHDSAVQAIVSQAIDHFGWLDILVNNAASFDRNPIPDAPVSAWDTIIAANLRAPFVCAHAVAPHMLRQGGGVIINITDLTAFAPVKGRAAHSVAKAGLISLTHALALDLSPYVRVNAIAPGPVIPPDDYNEAFKARIANRTLLKRWGSGDDVAKTVQFILENDYINAEVIRVDAGELFAWRDI